MPLSLKPEMGAAIDSQIWEIYRHRLGGSELRQRQLAKLFKRAGLLTRLENVLSPTLRHPSPHYREELEIRLARADLIRRFMAADDPALQQNPASSDLRRYFALRGTYWGISTDPARYRAGPGDLVQEKWRRLAGVGTWLHFLGKQETEDLVNWGNLVSDLALRSYIDTKIPVGTSLPVAPGSIKPGWRARAAKWIGDHLPAT